MKLIKPSTKIITPINGEEILKQIELAARTCYKSEGKVEYEDLMSKTYPNIVLVSNHIAKSAHILIPNLIQRGHFAMLEFGGMITVKFICDRGVSHELVRHRLCSFAQESTRYCNYEKAEHIQFIIPCWSTDIIELECSSIKDKYGLLRHDKFSTMSGQSLNWIEHMASCEVCYNDCIKLHNWSPQQARSVLPNSLKTEINISCNIREWREIFKQRTSNVAHPQMQELMRPLLAEFKSKIPILFDDINF